MHRAIAVSVHSYYMEKTKIIFFMGNENCRGAAYSHRDYRNRHYNDQKHVSGKCKTVSGLLRLPLTCRYAVNSMCSEYTTTIGG
jgi:hypothetical protein